MRTRILVAAALLATTSLAGARLGAQPRTRPGRPAVTPAAPDTASASGDGLARALRDTVLAHIVALELQRASVMSMRTELSAEVRNTKARLAALWEQVGELPSPEAARALANAQVLAALEARLASIAVQRREMLATTTSESASTRLLAEEATYLQQRRAELLAARASPAGAP